VAAGLLASAAMDGAGAKALRPTDARRVEAILRRPGLALAGYPQATGAHWRCQSQAGQRPQQSSRQNPSRNRRSPTTTGAPSASPADRPAGP
jgi:hypothetical protein